MQTSEISNAVFHALPTPCLILKPEGDTFNIVNANKFYFQLVQAQPEDLLGKPALQAFPHNPFQEGNDPALLSESIRKVMRTGEKDALECLRFDIPIRGTNEFAEKYWDFESAPIVGENGEVESILLMVRDVTAQVVLEKEGEIMQQQHRHFIDNNPDGLYSLDTSGNFISVNEGLAKITEVPLPELLKISFLPFCHPDDKEEIMQYFDRAIAGETIKFEARFISAKGRNMILHISLLPMTVNGRIEGAYGISKDLTSVRESQQVIVEKKRFLSANAGFISNLIDNDLRNSSLEEAFAMVGRTVGFDRMYYFSAYPHPESGELYLSQQVEWCSENASPQIDNEDLQDLAANEVQQMLGLSERGQLYTAFPNKMPEGELKELFLQQDIKSVLIIPIFLKGILHGFIGFDDCTGERQWDQEEISFLQSIAHNLTTALEKRAVEDALQEQKEALLKSERKFKAIVQEGSDLIAVLGQDGNYKFVNETSSAILGIPPDEFMGKTVYDFIHPDDQSKVTARLPELEKEKQVKFEPVRFRDSKGGWRWIETVATNLKQDPAVEGIVTHSRDITTLLNQAEEIKAINERYRLAATATQDLMYDWDLITDQVKRFHKTASFLGHYVEETNSRAFWREQIHPEELEGLKQHLTTTLNDPDRTFINTKYRFRRADGSYAHFLDRAYIIRDENGVAVRLVGATSDVSDITAKRKALKVANKRFRMAMKSTREMIWDWDIPSDNVRRSKAFKKLYGYTDFKKNPEKDYWMNKIHVDDKDAVKTSLFTALENSEKKKWEAEYRFLKANGEYARVTDRGRILRNKSGKAVRMVGAVLDVTASRLAMERIEAQNRRLKEISWEQSHVVRAPLVRILGLLQLIREGKFEDMSYHETWEHIETSANELDDVIRGIVKRTEEIGEL